jgi:hypothetical protein
MSAERPPQPCGLCPACAAGEECAAQLGHVGSPGLVSDVAQQFIARALEVVASGVPCQAIGWYPVGPHGEDSAGALIKLYRPLTADPEIARREYVLRYHRDDPFAPARHLDSRRPIVAMADIGGREGLLSTEYGSEFLPEFRAEWETSMYLRDGGRMLGFIKLARATEDGEFQAAELDFLERTHAALEHGYNSSLSVRDRRSQ